MSATDLDNAIGNLSITATGRDGVTSTLKIHTVAQTSYPKNIEAPMFPMLYPGDKWLGETMTTPRAWDNSVAIPVENVITLNYQFLYALVGEDRGPYALNEAAKDMLEALIRAIIRIDVHMNRIESVSTTPMMTVREQISGKSCFGCTISVKARSEEVSF